MASTVNTPNELELYMAADKRLAKVELIEAPEDNLYVVCCKPVRKIRLLCSTWNTYAEVLQVALQKKADDVKPIGELQIKVLLTL